MNFSVVLKTCRPNFLVLTPICIFLGVAITLNQGMSISWLLVSLAMLGGLLAHISVNTLNEYHDFVSGLDLKTQRTPFSGGSGALLIDPTQKNVVLTVGIMSLVMTGVIGLYFIYLYGFVLAPLGVLGMMIVVFYTRWINLNPWLCLIAPGLGFGILMVLGTQFVLTGEYWLHTLLIGVIPFLLLNNLLLLNQYPDVVADRSVGRHHLPIAYGEHASNTAYMVMWSLSLLTLISLIWLKILPIWSIIVVLPLLLGWKAWQGAKRYGFNIGQHPQYMAMNVLTALLTPFVLALSLLF